jgi:hypothetical protein
MMEAPSLSSTIITDWADGSNLLPEHCYINGWDAAGKPGKAANAFSVKRAARLRLGASNGFGAASAAGVLL